MVNSVENQYNQQGKKHKRNVRKPVKTASWVIRSSSTASSQFFTMFPLATYEPIPCFRVTRMTRRTVSYETL